MATRVLDIAVCERDRSADDIVSVVTETTAQLLYEGEHGLVRVFRLTKTIPGEATAANHHLVLTAGNVESRWSDASITSTIEAERLAIDRLVPWVTRWQEGRRAPRAQTAVLSAPDPTWGQAAARLIVRLRANTAGQEVLRIDHIGSTSVPGLAAKNLIDIQIMVASDDDAVAVAQAATGAGFVHVAGEWHGKDRNGQLHPEQVCVDADSGQPVNINIRSANRPVARDALLFRDWLRANPDARARYLDTKSRLAGRHVDDYGASKEPFISSALAEAETWASQRAWTL